MNISFIGIGNVGFALANNLDKKGHKIIIANNNQNSKSVTKALEKNKNFTVMPVQKAVDASEIVFLATPYNKNQEALEGIKFNGKTLIDCTNPVGMGVTHLLKSEISGAEVVQKIANDSKVVKAFTIYGYENFIDSSFPNYNVKPVMLYCGDDERAKKEASELIEQLGFFPKDTGALSQALHLEHMTLLWVKMVRLGGNPNFVWGYLEK